MCDDLLRVVIATICTTVLTIGYIYVYMYYIKHICTIWESMGYNIYIYYTHINIDSRFVKFYLNHILLSIHLGVSTYKFCQSGSRVMDQDTCWASYGKSCDDGPQPGPDPKPTMEPGTLQLGSRWLNCIYIYMIIISNI